MEELIKAISFDVIRIGVNQFRIDDRPEGDGVDDLARSICGEKANGSCGQVVSRLSCDSGLQLHIHIDLHTDFELQKRYI